MLSCQVPSRTKADDVDAPLWVTACVRSALLSQTWRGVGARRSGGDAARTPEARRVASRMAQRRRASMVIADASCKRMQQHHRMGILTSLHWAQNRQALPLVQIQCARAQQFPATRTRTCTALLAAGCSASRSAGCSALLVLRTPAHPTAVCSRIGRALCRPCGCNCRQLRQGCWVLRPARTRAALSRRRMHAFSSQHPISRSCSCSPDGARMQDAAACL
jgi:hypothetical protein